MIGSGLKYQYQGDSNYGSYGEQHKVNWWFKAFFQ